MRRSILIRGSSLVAFAIAMSLIWSAVFHTEKRELTVSYLDVGQGDSIFIDAPLGRQVLIDGGGDRSVLRELGKRMPWWDRTIDVVIATHPDADHISGLVDVLQRYRVGYIFQPGIEKNTGPAESILLSVAKEGAQEIYARRGQIINLGDGAYLEVLSPDRDVSDVDTNVGCIVTRLVYGDTAFMLPCDAPEAIEKYLVRLDGHELRSNVLKAGHHGSRTSSSVLFLGFVNPNYGVFSRGCDNSYGHPHEEVVKLFKGFEIPTLDTCEVGTVTFTSNGRNVSLRK